MFRHKVNFKFLFNNKGFADSGDGDKGKGAGDGDKGKAFSQDEVNRIVQERLDRERSKFSDYDDLKKFKSEHEREQDKIKQEELIKQKKYEEAEGNYTKQIGELQGIVTQKDNTIQSLQVEHALIGEITRQNGYVEESLALIKNSAVIRDGHVLIKIKDANGIEKEVTVDHGIKNFLDQKPHLVRAKAGSGGGGTGGAGSGAGDAGGGQGETLADLNTKLFAAISANDRKQVEELRKKITPLLKGNRFAA